MSTETSFPELAEWVRDISELTKPDDVVWCDGSEDEWERLTSLLVETGTFTRLNPKLRRTASTALPIPVMWHASRTARHLLGEEDDAGPTNNWIAPEEMRMTFAEIFNGCMRGRTMYVIPFCMGPLGSNISQLGVEITDSPYVAVSMRIMTRMGTPALRSIEETGSFVRAVHSVGAPLEPGQADVPWPCNSTKYISHFPETREIWSYGSGYGGNALLGKKCYALRIASVMARERAGSPSTCSSSRSPRRRARPSTSRPPSRPRAARPTWPCCSPPSPAGRSRPSATTSPGCGWRGRQAACDQPGGRLLRRRARHRHQDQRQCGRHNVGQQHLHQRGAHRRR